MIQVRRDAGKTDGNWSSGEAVFHWWLYGGSSKSESQIDGQMELEDFIKTSQDFGDKEEMIDMAA